MSLQEISTLLSPKTAEIVTPECWCDKPRSAQKTIEEVTAELLEEVSFILILTNNNKKLYVFKYVT